MTEINGIPTDWQNLVHRIRNKQGAYNATPSFNYATFVAETTKLFVQKDTDYDSRFMRALVDLNAFTIWKWEVDKKLDRLRTWLKRGELQVQGEGIRNSVDDLYIYTVQYVAYIQNVVNMYQPAEDYMDMVRTERVRFFQHHAEKLKPCEWVEFLVSKGLIGEGEQVLQVLLRSYMGDEVPIDDWRRAIREMLK